MLVLDAYGRGVHIYIYMDQDNIVPKLLTFFFWASKLLRMALEL